MVDILYEEKRDTQYEKLSSVQEAPTTRDVDGAVLNLATRGETNDGQDPWINRMLKPDGSPVCNFPVAANSVHVKDMRGRENTLALDAHGFTVVKVDPPAIDDILLSNDEEQIRAAYWPWVREVILKETQADEVLVYNHLLRLPRWEAEDSSLIRHPVRRVHVDGSPLAHVKSLKKYGPQIAGKSFDELRSQYKRVQQLNFWRPLKNAVYDWPLSLCDFRTFDVEKDLMHTRVIHPPVGSGAADEGLPDSSGFEVIASPQQEWWYYSNQEPTTALLFKNYDSASKNLNKVAEDEAKEHDDRKLDETIAGLTAHTAFFDAENANKHPDLKRHSIEVRALVLYK